MPCWVLSEGTVPSAVGGLGMVQVPRGGVSGEGSAVRGRWLGDSGWGVGQCCDTPR